MKQSYRLILTFTIIFISLQHQIEAQSLSILVKDHARLPLIGATVQMISLPDSQSVYRVTGTNGISVFESVENGLYLIKVSYVGFQTIEKTITVKTERRTIDFQMKEKEVSLNEVTITARKPLITQEDDKMIIDPEPLANSSTNTLEVLESTPGLYVDQDGNIFLNGASPAKIYINGREQKMSTEDIATLLRSLPPGSVQKIEIMRTPSTKYDASSSGGIVNVILKKGVKIGRFMSYNAGMNQGFYGNRFIGFSMNNSSDKLTSYVNANYTFNDVLEELNASRFFNADTVLHQNTRSRRSSHQGFVGYGIGYDINDNMNFSYDGRINANLPNSSSDVNAIIQTIENVTLSENRNMTSSDAQFLNLQQDFGLILKFDTLGSNLDTKFSFNYNNNASEQEYTNSYVLPISFSYFGDGNNDQSRYFIQLQSDLTYNFPYKIKIETGFKSSFQDYQNSTDYFLTFNGVRNQDLSRTNSFSYREQINSIYAQASKTLIWKFLLKTGVRMEHTYMAGHQIIPSDTNFLIQRTDWFPYVYLSRPLFKVADFELRAYIIYRKTINRPDYQSLNPYKKYIDVFEYETGNPNLKPQFNENVEVNVSYDEMPLFAIGQNYTTDIFSSVVYRDSENENVIVRTFDNIGKSKETYFRGMAGIPPGKKYFFGAGAQYSLNEYDGYYQGQPLKYSRGSWRFFSFHSLQLFKQTKITMFGFLMTNGSYNFYELNTFGSLNFGINQTLFDKKMTISLSARDVLRTMITQFELNQGGIRSNGDRYTDNQRFGFNIRYNFGIRKKQDKKGGMGFEMED